MEPALRAPYIRRDEFFQGRLISENLVVDEVFLGRLISQDSGDSDCLDVAAGWLERCSRQHEHCAEQTGVDLPTRLVHIPEDETQNLQVRNTEGQRGRYVALSHCWGSGIAFKTSQATFDARQEGFPSELLARNFQDAIRITRRLGFEYLWIDALCIIQDSTGDWANESSKMAQVYGNASLTISADLAPHSEFGILHPRNIMTSHQFGLHNELCLQTRGKGWAAIPSMPLTQRGWAFQERILSSRVLHFLEEQIAWECNTAVYLEENHARQLGHTAHFSKHNLTWVLKHSANSKGDSASLNAVESSNEMMGLDASNSKRDNALLHKVEPENKMMGLDDRIGNWNICLSELAVRNFTHVSDKLPSLSGLASAMEIPELGKYLAGVWECDPFLSMAWYPRWPQALRTEYRAPSWSWASTMWQLMWYKGWERDPTPAETNAWNMWNSRFAPRLLSHHIIHANVDLKGEVMEGSHIIVRGFCREVYIKENPDSRFEEWEFLRDWSRRLGRKVHMDSRGGKWNSSWDSTSYFSEDLENLDEITDRADLKSYKCFQIVREKGRDYPKILALILESVGGSDNTFRRAGLLIFDDKDSDSIEWKAQTLKLI
jgi:hypothetical protein